MDDYFPILAIVTIVIISGLSVIILDSNTGLVATGPGTPISAPATQEYICTQLKNEINTLVTQFKQDGCQSYVGHLPTHICPKPIKSGYIFQINDPNAPPPQKSPEYMKCESLAYYISENIKKLEKKAANSEACKNILQNLRAAHHCPRQVVS